jgi:hypothetical protein
VGVETTAAPEGTTIDVSNYKLIETRVLVRQSDGSWGGDGEPNANGGGCVAHV